MLNYSYNLPKEEIHSYISRISSASIDEILEYIFKMEKYEITAKDVFQFSSFDVCTNGVCKVLIEENNPGVTHIKAGELLQNDGKIRTDIANTKYGENQLKTAEVFGLVYSIDNTYFLSCLGYIWPELSAEEKENLLVRLVLRSKLVSRTIQATQNGSVQMRQFLYMLSDSTYKRRKTNIKTVFEILSDYKKYDFSEIINKIVL